MLQLIILHPTVNIILKISYICRQDGKPKFIRLGAQGRGAGWFGVSTYNLLL